MPFSDGFNDFGES